MLLVYHNSPPSVLACQVTCIPERDGMMVLLKECHALRMEESFYSMHLFFSGPDTDRIDLRRIHMGVLKCTETIVFFVQSMQACD